MFLSGMMEQPGILKTGSQVVQMGSIPVLLLDPTFMVLYQKNGTMFIAIQVDPCGIAS